MIADSPKDYRYFEAEYWPYNHFKAKFITEETSAIEKINFDASLINAKVTSDSTILRFDILDSSVINLQEFKFDIFSSENKKVLSGSFTDSYKEINLESLAELDYTIELYAINNRGGKS